MITEKEIVEKWLMIGGTSKENQESPACIFLDGRIFLNPEFLDSIESKIQSFKLSRKLNP